MQDWIQNNPIETHAATLIAELRAVEKLAYERDRNSPVGFLLTRQRNRLLRSLLKRPGELTTAARLLPGGRN